MEGSRNNQAALAHRVPSRRKVSDQAIQHTAGLAHSGLQMGRSQFSSLTRMSSLKTSQGQTTRCTEYDSVRNPVEKAIERIERMIRSKLEQNGANLNFN